MTTENWKDEVRQAIYINHFSVEQANDSNEKVINIIESLLSKERNKVLDEVKEEVEKNRGGFYEDSECGYALSIIENLKVK